MDIDRTWHDTLVDDSGSNTDGTIIDKADFTQLLDDVDEAIRGYFCKVYNNGTQSLTNDTVTGVEFNTEDSDVHGMHSIVSNASRITIPAGAGGPYAITASIPFASNTTGFRLCRFKVNGSNVGTDVAIPPANGSQTVICISTVLALAAADYVEIHAYQNSGGALDIGHASSRAAQCELLVVRVGE